MNARKMILMLAVIGMVFVVNNAYAGNAWYTCTVTRIGPAGTDDNVLIELTDAGGSFTSKWFIPLPGREKEVLAVGLTAISNSMNVYVRTDPNLSGFPPIRAIYITE